MHKALWIARKNHLYATIKKLSDSHGGDDIEWLREHCKWVLSDFPGERIEEAINCYEELVKELDFYPKRKVK